MGSLSDLFKLDLGNGKAAAASSTLTTSTAGQAQNGQTIMTSSGTIHAVKVGRNINRVHTSSGNTIELDDATLAGISDGTLDLSSYMMPTMTKAEREELAELKIEREKWVRREKLKAFKNLPAHLRQDIVDEAYILDSINKMNSVDKANFDGNLRLAELENKELRDIHFNNSAFYPQIKYDPLDLHNSPNNLNFKYNNIINIFTLDELTNAHSDATLEEQL